MVKTTTAVPDGGGTIDTLPRMDRLEALVDLLGDLALAAPDNPARRVVAGEFEALRTNDTLAAVGYDPNVAERSGAGYYGCCHCWWVGRYSDEPQTCEAEARKHLADVHWLFLAQHPDQGRVQVWEG